MKQLSKLFYITLFITGYMFFGLFLVIEVYMRIYIGIPLPTIRSLVEIGFPYLIPIFVLILVLTFKMWRSIRDIYARTTPIKAVLLLFIPVFNIYWMYHVLVGFAEDYNGFISRNEIETPPLHYDLFYAFFFLAVMSLIPFVGALPYLINLLFGPVIISEICDAVYAVNSALSKRAKGYAKAGAA